MSAITSPSNHITTSTQSHASADSSCSRPSSSATSKHSATTSSSSSSACAACKYQRRKCEPECPLAPYFPADNQRQFLNVHRLFGVSNLQKILKSVHSDYHHDAMRSVILQANIRAQDPVGGCQRQIINLTHHINDALVELMNVRKKIAEVKAQLDASSINPNLQLLPSPDVSLAYNNQNQLQLQLQQQYYNNNHLYDPLLQEVVQEPQDLGSQNPVQFDINVNAGGLQMEQQPFPPQMLTLHPHNPKDEEDAALAALPFSYKNEAYVDSNLLMQVQEHELKSAASLFTLTNDSRSTI